MGSSLGRLALGLVGAVIGSFFGVPAIGFAIGSAIGGFIFAPEGPNVEGPRLSDTDVQSSTVGKIIAEHYGTTRTGGNVFWTGGLKETKIVEEVEGGKGGGGATSTTYDYSVSFATALGKSPAQQIIKIWADGKLIYDKTGVSDTNNSKYNFRFNRGEGGVNTNPTVDPLIAESINRRLAGLPDINVGNQPQSEYTTLDTLIAELNAETDSRSALYAAYLTTLKDEAEAIGGTPPDYKFTPAYKEVAYIVFDDMPLEDFGNRIPNITAEVVWSTSVVANDISNVQQVEIPEIAPVAGIPPDAMAVDHFSRTAVMIGGGDTLRRFSQTAASETLSKPTDVGDGFVVNKMLCATSAGDFVARATIAGEDKLIRLDNTSLTKKTGGTSAQSGAASTALFACSAGVNASRSLIAATGAGSTFSLYDVYDDKISDAGYTVSGGSSIGAGPMVLGSATPGDSVVYWASTDGVSVIPHRVSIKFGASRIPQYTTVGGGEGIENVVIPSNPIVSFGVYETIDLAGGALSGILYDSTLDTLFILVDDGAGGGFIYQYDVTAGGGAGDPYLQEVTALPLPPPNIASGITRSTLNGGLLAYAYEDTPVLVNLLTGETTVYTNALTGFASRDTQVFDSNKGALFTFIDGVPINILFDRASGTAIPNDIGVVVDAICKRVGMEEDEYDVSEIVGFADVRGYTIGRPTNGRKVLENLFKAYFVEGIESDWKIRFKPRSSDPIRTIEEKDLGPTKGPTGNVSFLETRIPEYDLPAEIAMIYSDPNRDYQQGASYHRRVSQPVPVMYSKTSENIEMPIVLTENEAKTIAERILFFSWLSRDQSKAMLPWTHIDLDPGDIVEFKFNDGRVLTDRIEKIDIGANFSLELMSSRAGDPVYVKTDASSVTASTIPTNSIVTPAYARMFVLDIPLLYDYHDMAGVSSRYYVAVGSDSTNFATAEIYKSLDSTGYSPIDSANVDATWGTVTSGALPAPRALHSIDYDNSFTVALGVDNGNLSSTTLSEMVINETNRCVIYSPNSRMGEILQFQNVTANADGTYTFDTLVRGRRGTDQAVFGHTEGEIFILISDAAVLPEINPLYGIGTTQYFKAVSRGSLVPAAPSVGEIFDGNDLKPYAPNFVRRTDDGTDLTVLWNRRSRIGGAWNMAGTGVEDVPLNEDLEQYEVYLIAAGATARNNFSPLDASSYVVKAQTSLTSYMFTDVELFAAGYTSMDEAVNVAVYQLSAQVGRGFGRIVALAA